MYLHHLGGERPELYTHVSVALRLPGLLAISFAPLSRSAAFHCEDAASFLLKNHGIQHQRISQRFPFCRMTTPFVPPAFLICPPLSRHRPVSRRVTIDQWRKLDVQFHSDY